MDRTAILAVADLAGTGRSGAAPVPDRRAVARSGVPDRKEVDPAAPEAGPAARRMDVPVEPGRGPDPAEDPRARDRADQSMSGAGTRPDRLAAPAAAAAGSGLRSRAAAAAPTAAHRARRRTALQAGWAAAALDRWTAALGRLPADGALRRPDQARTAETGRSATGRPAVVRSDPAARRSGVHRSAAASDAAGFPVRTPGGVRSGRGIPAAAGRGAGGRRPGAFRGPRASGRRSFPQLLDPIPERGLIGRRDHRHVES